MKPAALLEYHGDEWIVLTVSRTVRAAGGAPHPPVFEVSFAGTLPVGERYPSLPPAAEEIGKAFGAGSFLLIGKDYSSKKVVEVTVVEASRYSEYVADAVEA